MIKKVATEALKPGMFIHDFNCDWMGHPFVFDQIMVRNKKMIEKIAQRGIREVYIDTTRGMDVPDASTVEDVAQKIDSNLKQLVKTLKKTETHAEKSGARAPIQEEIVRAKKIKEEARLAIQRLMDNVRFGKGIMVEEVYGVLDKMIDSVIRNKDALVFLVKIRRKDEYTYMHSVSVGALMIAFSRFLGMEYEDTREYGIGGLLHDVGKMMIPLDILKKPGKLTDEEIEVIKKHAVFSREIAGQIDHISETSLNIIAQHHERIDGAGYPEQLKGDEISRGGQMAAIVDVYDAITSDRVYRKGIPAMDALRKLYEWGNFHFNEELVQQFIRCVGLYPVGTLVQLESGRLAVVVETGKENLLQPFVRVVYDTRSDKFIPPMDLDLSQPASGDRITGHASLTQWRIEPRNYLNPV